MQVPIFKDTEQFRLANKNVRKHYLLYSLALLIVIIIGCFLFGSTNESSGVLIAVNSNAGTDLLDGQDWTHFAGATQDSGGIHIKPLGRAIVNQDGAPGQQNTPVNVRGPHIQTTGDFQITAGIQGISNKKASLQLYGEVPVIYDEWRHEGRSIRIDITNSRISASIWDGASDQPVIQKSFPFVTKASGTVIVRVVGEKVDIIMDSRLVGTLPSRRVFDSHTIWFGADAETGGNGWTLSSISAEQINKSILRVVKAPSLGSVTTSSDSLRALADKNPRKLPIGAAVAEYPLFTDEGYQKLTSNDFSMLTPENAMKAQFIHPLPAVYAFEDADNLVEFALKNNMQVHGHALVFGEANPAWMQALPLNQRKQAIVDHISTIVSHYRGKVSEWDVVNEPLADNDTSDTSSSDMRQTIWYQAMGEDYIDVAFKTAKQADPSAKLYINEFGLEADGDRWDSMVALIQRLKARGVPVDGVGFQSHVYEQADFIDAAVLKSHMEQLDKMGLSSRISEMDVTGDNPQTQAQQYADVLSACLNESSCTSFTTWGITDKFGSTTSLHQYPFDYGNNLLWDSNFNPKPSLISLQNVLKTK